MVKANQNLIASEVFFDSVGNALRLSRSALARRLGQPAGGRDPVDYAVRQLGFVRVQMSGSIVVVDLQTRTVNQLAVISAFYEIAGYEMAGNAPTTVVLLCRGTPDRFEVFGSFMPVFRRIEALTKRPP